MISSSQPSASYYGWRIAWTLAFTQTLGYGVLYYGFAVFIKPMEAEFGWGRAETSGAFSLALLVAGLAAIPVGRWVDRRGARALMTAGSVLGVLTLVGWSQIQGLAGLYLMAFGLGLAMAMGLYEVAFTVIAVWFHRERPRAMLIVTLVAGLASTIFVPLETWLVAALGWRQALQGLALMLALGAVPLHALVLRRHPRDVGMEPDGFLRNPHRPVSSGPNLSPRMAFQTAGFWWLLVAVAASRIAAGALGAHLVPLLLERGLTPGLAAAAAGSVGLMQLGGRLFFTPLTSRVSLPLLSALTLALHALAPLVLLMVSGLAGVWGFAALFGLSNGAITLVRSALLAENFGPQNYGQLNGVIALATAFTGAAAPLLAGLLHGAFGGYGVVLALLTLTTGFSTWAVTQVRPSADASPARN